MAHEAIADNFDYAIIDFCINDQQLERNGFLAIEDVIAAFGAMLAYFTPASRCRPLVILFPQRDAFVEERLMKVRSLTLSLCQLRGITVIDAVHLLNQASSRFGADSNSFFQDWAHMRSEHAPAFAELLRGTFQRVKSAKPTGIKFPTYSVLVPASLPRNRRGTSLMNADTYVLSKGENLRLKVDGYLCGFLHWHNHDTGTLLLDSGVEKLALPARKISPWDNRFAFSNLPSPVRCETALIRVGLDSDFPIVRSFGYTAGLPKDGSEIAFCGFVTADRNPRSVGGDAIRLLGRRRASTGRMTPSEVAFIRRFAGIPDSVSKLRSFWLSTKSRFAALLH